jgi:hypothetical protein
MKTQPNPALKNTAIFVGNNAELRKKAIEYYESEGYVQELMSNNEESLYIGTFFNDNTNEFSDFEPMELTGGYKLITLPSEPKSEYPKWMLVSHDNENWNEKLVITEHQNGFIANVNGYHYEHYDFAKDIPTVTLTQSELIEAYEKSNNVKVIIK